MSGRCQTLDESASLLQRIAAYVDCRADQASQAGFAGGSGGLEAAVLTACLTIFVALVGYRMILGRAYDGRAALLACARIGVVIAFSTSWASYQPVVQAVVMTAPAELTGALLRRMDVEPSPPIETMERLQTARRRALEGPSASLASRAPPVPAEQAGEGTVQSKTNTPGHSDLAELSLLFSGSGAYLAVRLAAGLLLALGPLLIPFALFDTTLGLIEAWIRTLIWTVLATAAAMIVSTLEVDFIEGELGRAVGGASAGITADGLDLASVLFGLTSLAAMALLGSVARLKLRPVSAPLTVALAFRPAASAAPNERRHDASTAGTMQSTAPQTQALAQAMTRLAQRERIEPIGQAFHSSRPESAGPAGSRGTWDQDLGQRRSTPRMTSSQRSGEHRR